MSLAVIPQTLRALYEVQEWQHATAILAMDFPEELADVLDILGKFTLKRSAIVDSPGVKTKVSRVSKELVSNFHRRGWGEQQFDSKISVGDRSRVVRTQSVECFKNGVALAIEWSDKDPAFDRDLNNFRLLFDWRVASVGLIITKSDELGSILENLGIWTKFGATSTWMNKLLPRMEAGGSGGCPLLVFGMRQKLYRHDQ